MHWHQTCGAKSLISTIFMRVIIVATHRGNDTITPRPSDGKRWFDRDISELSAATRDGRQITLMVSDSPRYPAIRSPDSYDSRKAKLDVNRPACSMVLTRDPTPLSKKYVLCRY